LWYGKDVVDAILEEGDQHEISFSGILIRYLMKRNDQEEARIEIGNGEVGEKE